MPVTAGPTFTVQTSAFEREAMAVKLYGSAGSPYFRLVALVATEFGVPYESLDIDDDEMKAAAYLEKQPFGQIPCIV